VRKDKSTALHAFSIYSGRNSNGASLSRLRQELRHVRPNPGGRAVRAQPSRGAKSYRVGPNVGPA
jgi:hypothetical protein